MIPRTIRVNATCVPYALLLLTVAAIGCGSQQFKHQPVPMSGVVKLDGQPISDVAVEFVSDSGLLGLGLTNAAGEFELAMPKHGPGIAPEVYQVRVMSQGDAKIPALYEEASVKTVIVEPGENQPVLIELNSKVKASDLAVGQTAQQ